MINSAPEIPQSDRIPLFQKMMFGAGACTEYLSTGIFASLLWMPYFNIGLGLNPVLLSVVLMILQMWNGILDPVMGNISDNARTRWGRRRPFMFIGAIMTSIMFLLVWRTPIGSSDIINGLWLTGAGMIFYACFSCWAMPYYGMQLELTPNYDERTRLNAWATFFNKINGLFTGWIMAFVSCSYFANPVTGRPDIVRGIQVTSCFIALAILIVGLLPSLFVKERYYEAEASKQAREPFWQSIRESASCGPLWLWIGISFFLLLGYTSVSVLGSYVNIYYVMAGRIDVASVIGGWKSTAVFVTGILTIPLWTWLGEKFDKRTIVGAMLAFSAIGHGLNYWCMTPAHPYWQLIPGVFESGTIGALWIFLPSMKGDVADWDELHTTRRREGSINGFSSWFFKAALACSTGIGGLLLQLTGFTAKTVEQPPDVLQRMLWMYLVIPLVIWSIAFYFVCRYPLTREKMFEIRQELEKRRGKL